MNETSLASRTATLLHREQLPGFIVWYRIRQKPYERQTLNICLINSNPLYLTVWVEQPGRALQFKVKAIVKLQLVKHVTEYGIYPMDNLSLVTNYRDVGAYHLNYHGHMEITRIQNLSANTIKPRQSNLKAGDTIRLQNPFVPKIHGIYYQEHRRQITIENCNNYGWAMALNPNNLTTIPLSSSVVQAFSFLYLGYQVSEGHMVLYKRPRRKNKILYYTIDNYTINLYLNSHHIQIRYNCYK